MSVCALNFSYFGGAVYYESHLYLSRRLREIHAEIDLTDAFRALNLARKGSAIEFQDIILLGFVVLFTCVLQSVLILNTDAHAVSLFTLVTQNILAGVLGLLLFCRIWFLHRKLLLSGLESVFVQMEHTQYQTPHQTIPLHSLPALARFEQSFNYMSDRLRLGERELSALISHSAEQSRYATLGEMSGLIAHDLLNPLHAALFHTTSLLEEVPQNSPSAQKLSYLQTNLGLMLNLTQSLRARVKNQSLSQGVALSDAHHAVIDALKTQYPKKTFEQIRFRFDVKPADLRFQLPSTDLIQILDNLYRNCIQSAFAARRTAPEVQLEVDLTQESSEFFVIKIRDNGSGLSPERFEELTAFQFQSNPNQISAKEGLGLRLTRRLIEYHRGTLSVEPIDPTLGVGTQFRMVWPINVIMKSDEESQGVLEASPVPTDAQAQKSVGMPGLTVHAPLSTEESKHVSREA